MWFKIGIACAFHVFHNYMNIERPNIEKIHIDVYTFIYLCIYYKEIPSLGLLSFEDPNPLVATLQACPLPEFRINMKYMSEEILRSTAICE